MSWRERNFISIWRHVSGVLDSIGDTSVNTLSGMGVSESSWISLGSLIPAWRRYVIPRSSGWRRLSWRECLNLGNGWSIVCVWSDVITSGSTSGGEMVMGWMARD